MASRSSKYSDRRLTAAAAVSLAALIMSCDVLFMPPTGVPEEGPNPRATPRGAIEHLLRAYENKRIDHFTELLPQNGTYRFFISPEYSAAYTGTDAILERVEDGQYHYVRSGNYHYWGHESELAKHRKMFSMTGVTIEFREYPIIDERDFRYRVTDDGDTVQVEARMTAGELCVGFKDTLYCTRKDAQMQVFLLEREIDRRTGERLWIIKDWFDLDYLWDGRAGLVD